MVWPLLLALGGGTVADGYFNEGRITRQAGHIAGEAFGNIAGGGNNNGGNGGGLVDQALQKVGLSNVGQGDGQGSGQQRGLMDLLGSSEALFGGGGLAGALTLSFTPGVPDMVKKLAWGAAIMNLVYQAFKLFTNKDFDSAADGQNAGPLRQVVMRDGFDPTNPAMVGQTRDGQNPEGPLTHVEVEPT